MRNEQLNKPSNNGGFVLDWFRPFDANGEWESFFIRQLLMWQGNQENEMQINLYLQRGRKDECFEEIFGNSADDFLTGSTTTSVEIWKNTWCSVRRVSADWANSEEERGDEERSEEERREEEGGRTGEEGEVERRGEIFIWEMNLMVFFFPFYDDLGDAVNCNNLKNHQKFCQIIKFLKVFHQLWMISDKIIFDDCHKILETHKIFDGLGFLQAVSATLNQTLSPLPLPLPSSFSPIPPILSSPLSNCSPALPLQVTPAIIYLHRPSLKSMTTLTCDSFVLDEKSWRDGREKWESYVSTFCAVACVGGREGRKGEERKEGERSRREDWREEEKEGETGSQLFGARDFEGWRREQVDLHQILKNFVSLSNGNRRLVKNCADQILTCINFINQNLMFIVQEILMKHSESLKQIFDECSSQNCSHYCSHCSLPCCGGIQCEHNNSSPISSPTESFCTIYSHQKKNIRAICRKCKIKTDQNFILRFRPVSKDINKQSIQTLLSYCPNCEDIVWDGRESNNRFWDSDEKDLVYLHQWVKGGKYVKDWKLLSPFSPTGFEKQNNQSCISHLCDPNENPSLPLNSFSTVLSHCQDAFMDFTEKQKSIVRRISSDFQQWENPLGTDIAPLLEKWGKTIDGKVSEAKEISKEAIERLFPIQEKGNEEAANFSHATKCSHNIFSSFFQWN